MPRDKQDPYRKLIDWTSPSEYETLISKMQSPYLSLATNTFMVILLMFMLKEGKCSNATHIRSCKCFFNVESCRKFINFQACTIPMMR
jgi:hypothetical protein